MYYVAEKVAAKSTLASTKIRITLIGLDAVVLFQELAPDLVICVDQLFKADPRSFAG